MKVEYITMHTCAASSGNITRNILDIISWFLGFYGRFVQNKTSLLSCMTKWCW